MTRTLSRILFLIWLTVLSGAAAGDSDALAQSPAAGKEPATIAGRVTLDGVGAPGAQVMLKPYINDGVTRIIFGPEQPPALGAATDAEGRYRLTDVPPGTYRISVFAPAYAVDGESDPLTPGKTVNVAEGENVENLDFSLTRGAVITGRVTDENDRPVIAAPINAYKLNAKGKRERLSNLFTVFQRRETDDRGVYRIFGLEAGRYLVAAGNDSGAGQMTIGGGYRGAFHPDAVEETQANVVEVKSGEEATNINIIVKVASPVKGYIVSGRVVEADTDRPVPGVTVNYNEVGQRGISIGTGRSAVTNALGEFRFQNVPPNSYRAFILNINAQGRGAPAFGDEIKFDVVDGGARLPSRLLAHLAPAESEAKDDVLRFVEARVESDGAFSFSNLAPGKYWLLARPTPEEPNDKPIRPAAWDASERAKLRREAEAANITIELKPCQRVSDYKLHYSK